MEQDTSQRLPPIEPHPIADPSNEHASEASQSSENVAPLQEGIIESAAPRSAEETRKPVRSVNSEGRPRTRFQIVPPEKPSVDLHPIQILPTGSRPTSREGLPIAGSAKFPPVLASSNRHPVDTMHIGNQNGEHEDEIDEEHRVIAADPTGRFECYTKCLGMGAYKRVHLGFDQEEGVEVAWNELRLDHLQKKDIMKILSEVQILQQLRHDSIINFFHCWMAKGPTGRDQVFFITELMTSGTLKSYIRKTKGAIKPKVLKNWCRQILRGLLYLHTRDPPIIHRDLKCENIFINGNNGQAKIGDLGLATFKSREHMSSVLGTPEFMAPELYDERYDEKVDIYAFGMCCLEMVTKEYPYNECTNQAQIFRKVTQNIKPASLNKITDKEVREFIDICIEHDPKKRPSTEELLRHPFLAMESSTVPSSNISAKVDAMVVLASTQISPENVTSYSAPGTILRGAQQELDAAARALANLQLRHTSSGGICSVEVIRVTGRILTVKMICLGMNSSKTSEDGIPTQEVKFPFNIDEDTPELVIDEMMKEEVLRDTDRIMAVENLRTAVRSVVNVLSEQNSPNENKQSLSFEMRRNKPEALQLVSNPWMGSTDDEMQASRKRSRSSDFPIQLSTKAIANSPLSRISRSRSLSVSAPSMRWRGRSTDATGYLSSPSSPTRNDHLRRRLSESISQLSRERNGPPTNVSKAAPYAMTSENKAFVADLSCADIVDSSANPQNSSSQTAEMPPIENPTSTCNSPISHYHKTIDQKTSEIIEGVYRSQYRRAGNISSSGSQSQINAAGSQTNLSLVADQVDTKTSQLGDNGSRIVTAPAEVIESEAPATKHSSSRTSSPQSLVTSPTTANSPPNTLTRHQALHLLNAIVHARKAEPAQVLPLPAGVSLPETFWQLDSTSQLTHLERLLTDKAIQGTIAQSQRSLSVDAERQLALLQNLALSEFDAQTRRHSANASGSVSLPTSVQATLQLPATSIPGSGNPVSLTLSELSSMNTTNTPLSNQPLQGLAMASASIAASIPRSSTPGPSVLLSGDVPLTSLSLDRQPARSRSTSAHSRSSSYAGGALVSDFAQAALDSSSAGVIHVTNTSSATASESLSRNPEQNTITTTQAALLVNPVVGQQSISLPATPMSNEQVPALKERLSLHTSASLDSIASSASSANNP